jgi:hypothetical protein
LEPHWNPSTFPLGQVTPTLIEQTATSLLAEPAKQTNINEQVSIRKAIPEPGWWEGSGMEIVRATRSWIQYGTVAFTVICIVIGAVEALAGR